MPRLAVNIGSEIHETNTGGTPGEFVRERSNIMYLRQAATKLGRQWRAFRPQLAQTHLSKIRRQQIGSILRKAVEGGG